MLSVVQGFGVLSGLVADFHAAQPCGSEAWEHWDWKAINIEKVSGLCAKESLGVAGAAGEEKLLVVGVILDPCLRNRQSRRGYFSETRVMIPKMILRSGNI